MCCRYGAVWRGGKKRGASSVFDFGRTGGQASGEAKRESCASINKAGVLLGALVTARRPRRRRAFISARRNPCPRGYFRPLSLGPMTDAHLVPSPSRVRFVIVVGTPGPKNAATESQGRRRREKTLGNSSFVSRATRDRQLRNAARSITGSLGSGRAAK